MARTLSSNIWKILSDRFIASIWFVGPALIPFYEHNGFDATTIYMIQSIYSIALCLLEIPTGYLSDFAGRRVALITGAILFPVGLAIYVSSSSFWGFVAAEIVIALAISMRSGTDSALLFDTLRELDRDKQHKRYEGICHFLEKFGNASSAALCGVLMLSSIYYPFYANILASFFLLPLALFIKEPRKSSQATENHESHWSKIVKVVKFCLSHKKILGIMVYAAALLATGICGIWSYYLYYSSINIPTEYQGALFSIFALVSGVGGKLTHHIESKIGRTASFLLPMLIVPNFFLLSKIGSIYMLAVIYLNGFLWGFSMPLLKDAIHRLTNTHIRATTLSVMNVVGRLFFVVLSILTGAIIKNGSLEWAYAFLGTFLLISGSTALFPLLFSREKSRVPV